jgi:predicted ferric reductase
MIKNLSTSPKPSDIELKPIQNIILIEEEKHNISQSKYQKKHPYKLWNTIQKSIEQYRWKINLLLLIKPLSYSFLIYHQCKFSYIGKQINKFNNFIYELTWIEIIIYVILAISLTIQCFLDGETQGSVATIWFAITWILAMRNNFLFTELFGLSFERVIQFHRTIGRFAIIMVCLHFWSYRRESWFKGIVNFSGSIGLIFALLIGLTSLGIIRRQMFEIFYKFHWILFVSLTIACLVHGAGGIMIGVIGLIIDCLFRFYSIYYKPVSIKNVELLNGNVIKIKFDKKDFEYEAGQYVFICIPSISLSEFHPFSISSSPYDNECVQIHIRVLGDWTKKLQTLVGKHQEIESYDWKKLLCYMEGPYGQLQVQLEKYSELVMISGGIGITPLQSIFNELLHNISNNIDNHLKKIHFIWVVRDPSMIDEFDNRHWSGIEHDNVTYCDKLDNEHLELPKYFSPNLIIMSKNDGIDQKTEIITHFYITRVDEDQKSEYIEKFPFLRFGRPDIQHILKEINESKHDTAVLCCGPNGMVRDVKKYAVKYDIDCHTEIFSF